MIITVEEHNVIDDLRSAVCEILTVVCPVPIVHVVINDVYGETGHHEALLDRFGLIVQDIVSAVSDAFSLRDQQVLKSGIFD